MAAAYSTRFLVGNAAAGTTVATYTVPTGKRAIVRQFTLVDGGSAPTFAISAPGANSYLVVLICPAGNGVRADQLHLVFEAGETVQVYRIAGAGYYSVHGYLLDA